MRQFFLLLFLPAMMNSLPAMHLVGGSMRYYYETDGQLTIELELFRDCNSTGASLNPMIRIGVYRGNSLFEHFQTQLDSVYQLDISAQNCANFPLNVCLQRGLYRFPVDLPVNEFTYTVVYQRCCLNEAYSNVLSPDAIGFTMQIALTPEARALQNDGPAWPNITPQFVACIHEPEAIDFSIAEPEGDSLVYFLCNPLAGGGPITNGPALNSCAGAVPSPPCGPPFDLVPMSFGDFSASQPLGQNSASTFTPAGEWQFTPGLIGTFLYALCVEEYRDSVLLSRTQRVLTLFVGDGSSGATEPARADALVCSPNPAGTETTVVLPDGFSGETIRLSVRDASGRLFFSKTFRHGETPVVPLGDWPPGWYFLQAESERHLVAGRLLKQ